MDEKEIRAEIAEEIRAEVAEELDKAEELRRKQLRVNTMNINALVQAVEAQGKRLRELEQLVQVQARSLLTQDNALNAMRVSLAQATAVMGTGPTQKG